MIHPETQLRLVDEVVGWGVFATACLPRGTVTWVRDPLDQLLDPRAIAALGPHWQRWSEHHTFGDRDGRRVLCWDLCRSMNHSCRPNCAGTELGFEIAIVDIEPGDELTNDYCTLRIDPAEGFVCRCGQRDCRGEVRPDLTAIARQHPAIMAAVELAPAVPQALAGLLPPSWRSEALAELTAARACG